MASVGWAVRGLAASAPAAVPTYIYPGYHSEPDRTIDPLFHRAVCSRVQCGVFTGGKNCGYHFPTVDTATAPLTSVLTSTRSGVPRLERRADGGANWSSYIGAR